MPLARLELDDGPPPPHLDQPEAYELGDRGDPAVGGGSPYRLRPRTAPRRARAALPLAPPCHVSGARAAGRYFLTGEKFGADEAAAIGLVTVAAEDVSASVAAIVAQLQRGSPQGLAASKALTTRPILDEFDRRAEELTVQSARLFVSDEAREGMLAFLQKRPPRWVSTG